MCVCAWALDVNPLVIEWASHGYETARRGEQAVLLTRGCGQVGLIEREVAVTLVGPVVLEFCVCAGVVHVLHVEALREFRVLGGRDGQRRSHVAERVGRAGVRRGIELQVALEDAPQGARGATPAV